MPQGMSVDGLKRNKDSWRKKRSDAIRKSDSSKGKSGVVKEEMMTKLEQISHKRALHRSNAKREFRTRLKETVRLLWTPLYMAHAKLHQ